MRALVTGWFSFPWMGATAGDLLAAQVVESWLDAVGCPHDRAVADTMGGDGHEAIDPATYTHLVFVCGPLGPGEPVLGLLDRYSHARRIGVDLSMLRPLDEWQPFDLLLERDSDRTTRPDISLLAAVPRVPVIALVLVHDQKEYDGARHAEVHAAVRAAVADTGAAVVPVDTCFDPPNSTGLTTPEQVVSVLAKADVVVTTRLHGLVLGLGVGVPVVAVDPIVGGAKVARQAAALEWPEILLAEEVSVEAVTAAVRRCLGPDGRASAERCAQRAREALANVRAAFLAGIAAD